MARLSRPMLYGTVIVLLGAAYAVFGQSSDAKKMTGFKPTIAKPGSKNKDADITQEDKTAKFPATQIQMRNVFMPLVIHGGSARGVAGLSGPVTIPAELTQGDQNWVYTGMAEVNTVPQALVENTLTQDGVFLKQGERWKDATVFQITPDTLVLVGPDGIKYEVKVLGSQEQLKPTPVAGLQPVAVTANGDLQGQIGTADAQTQPSRRRRGGGGRNGGGFGGGFGGGAAGQPTQGGDTAAPGANGYQPSITGDTPQGGNNVPNDN